MHFAIPWVLRHFIDDLNVETDTDKLHVLRDFRQRPVIKPGSPAQPTPLRIEGETGHKDDGDPIDFELAKIGLRLGQAFGVDLKIALGIDDLAKFQRSILPIQPGQADFHTLCHQAGQPIAKIGFFRQCWPKCPDPFRRLNSRTQYQLIQVSDKLLLSLPPLGHANERGGDGFPHLTPQPYLTFATLHDGLLLE